MNLQLASEDAGDENTRFFPWLSLSLTPPLPPALQLQRLRTPETRSNHCLSINLAPERLSASGQKAANRKCKLRGSNESTAYQYIARWMQSCQCQYITGSSMYLPKTHIEVA